MTDAPELTAEDWSEFDGGEAREPKRSRLTPIRFQEILMSPAPPCVVGGLIPRAGLIVVWGPPKSGKSYWAFDLVMHIALARDYRGRRVEHGAVVYIACEGATGLRNRVQAFRQEHLDNGASDPPFYLVPDALDLVSECPTLIAQIERGLGDTKPSVVVLDTLNRSMAGSENDPADMAAYIKAADALRETFGCAVIVVHHCGTEGSRPRGHTSLTGACDAQISIKRDATGLITATVEFMKDGPEGDTIASRLEAVEIGRDTNGDPITACVVVKAEGADRDGAAPRVSGKAKIALDLLKKAINEAGETPPASVHRPDKCLAVKESLWRQYCYLGGLTESDNPDTRQKTFVRARNILLERQAIGFWEGWVWLAN